MVLLSRGANTECDDGAATTADPVVNATTAATAVTFILGNRKDLGTLNPGIHSVGR